MKAVRLHGYGGVDQLKVEDIAEPAPGPGEVLVQVAAAALNPVDSHLRQGWMAAFMPLDFPAILGSDLAGTIVEIADGVEGYALGDRVIAFLPPNGCGAYAERVAVPVAYLAKLPANVSFEAGAALPLASLTARQSVDALDIKAGDRVLVAGALGPVGRVVVQYLKMRGAAPVAGVRSERLAEGVALAGEALDISQIPGVPHFDYAVSLAAPIAASIPKFARDGGKIASPVMTPEEANPNGRVHVTQIIVHPDQTGLQQISDAAGRGELQLPIVKTFKLGEMLQAQHALESSPAGKILVLI